MAYMERRGNNPRAPNHLIANTQAEYQRRMHEQAIRRGSAKPGVDDHNPAYGENRRLRNPKKEAMMEEKYAQIEHDNLMLLRKMHGILSSSGRFSGLVRYGPRSLNINTRRKELEKIAVENQNILKGLRSVRPTFDNTELRKAAAEQERYVMNMSAYATGRRGDPDKFQMIRPSRPNSAAPGATSTGSSTRRRAGSATANRPSTAGTLRGAGGALDATVPMPAAPAPAPASPSDASSIRMGLPVDIMSVSRPSSQAGGQRPGTAGSYGTAPFGQDAPGSRPSSQGAAPGLPSAMPSAYSMGGAVSGYQLGASSGLTPGAGLGLGMGMGMGMPMGMGGMPSALSSSGYGGFFNYGGSAAGTPAGGMPPSGPGVVGGGMPLGTTVQGMPVGMAMSMPLGQAAFGPGSAMGGGLVSPGFSPMGYSPAGINIPGMAGGMAGGMFGPMGMAGMPGMGMGYPGAAAASGSGTGSRPPSQPGSSMTGLGLTSAAPGSGTQAYGIVPGLPVPIPAGRTSAPPSPPTAPAIHVVAPLSSSVTSSGPGPTALARPGSAQATIVGPLDASTVSGISPNLLPPGRAGAGAGSASNNASFLSGNSSPATSLPASLQNTPARPAATSAPAAAVAAPSVPAPAVSAQPAAAPAPVPAPAPAAPAAEAAPAVPAPAPAAVAAPAPAPAPFGGSGTADKPVAKEGAGSRPTSARARPESARRRPGSGRPESAGKLRPESARRSSGGGSGETTPQAGASSGMSAGGHSGPSAAPLVPAPEPVGSGSALPAMIVEETGSMGAVPHDMSSPGSSAGPTPSPGLAALAAPQTAPGMTIASLQVMSGDEPLAPVDGNLNQSSVISAGDLSQTSALLQGEAVAGDGVGGGITGGGSSIPGVDEYDSFIKEDPAGDDADSIGPDHHEPLGGHGEPVQAKGEAKPVLKAVPSAGQVLSGAISVQESVQSSQGGGLAGAVSIGESVGSAGSKLGEAVGQGSASPSGPLQGAVSVMESATLSDAGSPQA